MYKRLTYDYVKDYIENEGYELISTEYKNVHSKLKVKCPNNHIIDILFGNFNRGIRCKYCYKENKRLTYDYVKNYIENEGYELISTEYVDVKTPLELKCPDGHIFEGTNFNSFKNGIRCSKCNGGIRLTYDYVKDYIENEGYELISTEYKNSSIKLRIKCQYNHYFNMSFGHFKGGEKCPICQRKKSVNESKIADIVKSLYEGTIIENDRTTIKNPKTGFMLELDIYLPEINKAIEYNGSYWHSNECVIYRDEIKKKICNEKNIKLLIIGEKEWLNNRNTSIQSIQSFLS